MAWERERLPLEQYVMQTIETLQPKLVGLTQELIRRRSVNPPGDETEVAKVLHDELASIGMRVNLHEAVPKRVNLEATLRGLKEGPIFLFNGHTDVVPEGDHTKWTVDPFGGVVKGDLIFGRGAADMKGALAAVTVGLRGIVDAGLELNGHVVFHAVADEEENSLYGTRYMIDKGLAKADIGIVAEGSVFGHKIAIRPAVRGNCWIRLKTFGKAAHASNPSNGINAVLNMSKLLLALDKLRLEHRSHRILPDPTISAGTVIKGGTKTNVIPEYCEAEVDVRIVPGMTEQQVTREFSGVIERLTREDSEFAASADVFSYTPAAEIPESSPIIEAASNATQRVVGYTPMLAAGHGTNDSVYLIRDAGIPVICGFGPGDNDTSNAHGADENVSASELVNFAKIYALTAMSSLRYSNKR